MAITPARQVQWADDGLFALGIALSPVWALISLPTVGWRWTLALTAPFALLIGAMRGLWPESPRWLLSQGRAAEAEAVVTAIEARVGRSTGPLPPVPAASPVAPTPPVRPGAVLGAGLLPLTLMLWLVWFTEYGVLYTFQSVLPTLLAADGFSIVRSIQFSVVIFSGFIPGYMLSGVFLDWFDRKHWLMLSFLGIGVSGTLFGFAVGTLGRRDRYGTTRLDRWFRGRVAIVGDAAHAMPSSLGQGAGVSMMNALELAKAMASDPVEGLPRWEAAIRPVVERWQAQAEQVAEERNLATAQHPGHDLAAEAKTPLEAV